MESMEIYYCVIVPQLEIMPTESFHPPFNEGESVQAPNIHLQTHGFLASLLKFSHALFCSFQKEILLLAMVRILSWRYLIFSVWVPCVLGNTVPQLQYWLADCRQMNTTVASSGYHLILLS